MTSISRETRRVAGSGGCLSGRDSDELVASIRAVRGNETAIRAVGFDSEWATRNG